MAVSNLWGQLEGSRNDTGKGVVEKAPAAFCCCTEVLLAGRVVLVTVRCAQKPWPLQVAFSGGAQLVHSTICISAALKSTSL